MKKKILNIESLFLGLSILLTSCSTTNYFTKVNFVSFEDKDCSEKADNMYVFYQGDSLDFEYTQLGLIEAEAGENSSKSETETLIKFEAWENCANAVIGLPKSFKENNPLNQQKSISCYAVKVKRDSAFLAKYGDNKNTSFVDKGKLLKQNAKNEQRGSTFTRILVGFALVGLVIFGVILIAFAVTPFRRIN